MMLLDTSGLLCLYDVRDHRHSDAQTLYRAAWRRLTHNYVLAEFVALVHARGVPRGGALSFISDLLDNPEVEVIWADEQLHRADCFYRRDLTRPIRCVMPSAFF